MLATHYELSEQWLEAASENLRARSGRRGRAAAGDTAKEMDRVLGFKLSGDKIGPAFKSLADELKAHAGQDCELVIASRFFLHRNYSPLPSFREALAAFFSAGVESVDFSSAASALAAVNAWA
jgi:serine protease inhibitor